MARIENKTQYNWALKRVEELLPLVDDNTPLDDPNSIELELLSNMIAHYSEEYFSLGEPALAGVMKLRMYKLGICQLKLPKMLSIIILIIFAFSITAKASGCSSYVFVHENIRLFICVNEHDCPSVRKQHKAMAKILNDYIQEKIAHGKLENKRFNVQIRIPLQIQANIVKLSKQ